MCTSHPQVDNDATLDKEQVKENIINMSMYDSDAQPALLTICMEGIEVFDKTAERVSMAHAMNRISYMSAHPSAPIVGFVAKNPQLPERYCHVFILHKRKRALQLHKKLRVALKIVSMENALAKNKPLKSKSSRATDDKAGDGDKKTKPHGYKKGAAGFKLDTPDKKSKKDAKSNRDHKSAGSKERAKDKSTDRHRSAKDRKKKSTRSAEERSRRHKSRAGGHVERSGHEEKLSSATWNPQ